MASITTIRSICLITTALALAAPAVHAQDQAPAAPTPTSALSLPDGSQDIAVVNGEGITWGDFVTNLQAYQPSKTEVGVPIGRSMLEHLIVDKIVEQLARKDGVYPTDAQIDDQYHNYTMLQEAASVLPFSEQLRQVGLTADDAKRERITPQLCQLNLLSRGIATPDDIIKEYYEQNKEQFTQPARAHIKRMVFSTSGAADAALDELHKGKSFEEVYPKSIDQELPGGDVPTWLAMDATEPTLAPIIAAINKTAVGGTTDPIPFQGAYWLINVVEKKPSELWPLDEVKSMVRIEIVENKVKAEPAIQTKTQEEMRSAQMAADIKVTAPQYQPVVDVVKNPPPVQAPAAAPTSAKPPAATGEAPKP